MTASARHGQQCSADLGEIARSFAILGERGAVIEVRALGVPRVKVVAGYFDDPERAAASAARVSERATGVYATLNRINPALLARAANRLVDGLSPLTSDADITRRTRLLIDFDPRRPTGISSTEAEHDA